MSQPDDNGGTPSPELVALCETVYRKWWEDTPDGASVISIAHAYAIAFSKMERELAAMTKERDAFKIQVEATENEADMLIRERDSAEDAADRLTSLILGEPIDWSDHGAKWQDAIEEAAQLAASEARAAKLEEALELAMSRAFAGMIGVSDELLQEWADDTRLSPDMRQDAIDYMRCRALLQPSTTGRGEG